MGMSIDEAIEICEHIASDYPHCRYSKALNLAIDTMRKYQNMEQAYSAYLETMNPDTLADLISTII